jgi:hypothetical protein
MAEDDDADEDADTDEDRFDDDLGDHDNEDEDEAKDDESSDATPPPASLPSTIALASANSFSFLMVRRTPIRFLENFLRFHPRLSLSTCISV